MIRGIAMIALFSFAAAGCASDYLDGNLHWEGDVRIGEDPDLQMFEITLVNRVDQTMCISSEWLPSPEGWLPAGEKGIPFEPYVVEGDRFYHGTPYRPADCKGCKVRLRPQEVWQGRVTAAQFRGLDLSKAHPSRQLYLQIMSKPC